MDKNTVSLEFLGQRISVKSDANPEMVEDVVSIAKLKLTDAEKRARGAAAHQIALLALLDITEEYVKAKKRAVDYRKEVSEKTSQLFGLIEAEIK